MHEFFWKHDVGIKLALLLLFVLTTVNLIVLNKTLLRGTKAEPSTGLFPFPKVSLVDTCGADCQKEISEKVAEAIATISAQRAPQISKTATTTSSTSYIPISGSFTTTKLDWADIKTSDFYLDPADYGKNPQVSWEAFLKVAHGNGKVFARLFDVTHGIGVSGSEVSATSADFSQVSSGNLSIWSGRNLYRVQIKSLNSFEVTFDSGRVKITSE